MDGANAGEHGIGVADGGHEPLGDVLTDGVLGDVLARPGRVWRAQPDAGQVARSPEVVVWEADGRAAFGGYGRAITRRLLASGFGVVTVPLVERAPSELELTAPMHVVSGGDTAIDADVAWLRAARERLGWVLDEALAGRASVTGICFGSQLIAHLLAGPDATDEHPDGIQAGMTTLHRRPRDRDDEIVSSFHFHRIRRDPLMAAGADVVIDSPRTEVQAYRFGRHVRGVQFHPELDPLALDRAMRVYPDVLERHGSSLARVQADIADRHRGWTDRPWHEFVTVPARRSLAAAA